VVEDDRPLPLGSPKQQALLAVLVLHRGEPVPSERLIDELWGEQPPASAIKNVQGYVSNLRKVLGDGRLITRAAATRCRRVRARSTLIASSRSCRKVAARCRQAMRELPACISVAGWRFGAVRPWRISHMSRSRSRRSRD